MAGNWEPKMFLYRRGDGAFCDIEALWKDIHSDPALDRLQELGVNVCHIHFHKGYGLEHEHESIQEAKRWARQLHERGIRVGAYIGSTMFTETFDPDARAAMAMQNQVVGWSGAQYFRQFWCWNNPAALDYFKKVIRVAIEEVLADVLHLDSGFAGTHDQLCRCEHCLAAFRTFVREQIPEIARAAGYEDPGLIQPPPAGNLGYLATVEQMREPGDIAWTLYHAQAGTQALGELCRYARSLSRDVTVLYNGAALCGITPYSRPNMEIQPMEYVDATAAEDDLENPIGLMEDGRPLARFRAYKAAARRKTRVYYYTSGNNYDARLPLTEAAAFNYGCLGMVELAMQANRRIKAGAETQFLQYLVRHEDLFLDRQPWHRVAVVRHHESMLLNPYPSGLAPYVIEQLLFEEHVPFGIIGGDELSRGTGLSDFAGLILPESRCLSDQELENVQRFAEQGGWVLSIGSTGAATPLNQFRARWGMADWFGQDHAAQERAMYEEVAGGEAAVEAETQASRSWSARVGRGRVIHLERLGYQRASPQRTHRFAGFVWYSHPWWQRPTNADQVMRVLDELEGGRQALVTNLSAHVGIETYRAAGGYRLHLVNYKTAEAVKPAHLSLRLEEAGVEAAIVHWHTPQGTTRLAGRVADRCVEVDCPGFEVLATLDVRPETKSDV